MQTLGKARAASEKQPYLTYLFAIAKSLTRGDFDPIPVLPCYLHGLFVLLFNFRAKGKMHLNNFIIS